MKMILPLLACALALLAGCGRHDPATLEDLIGELPSDCQPSVECVGGESARVWDQGGADRAATWLESNPFLGRHVEFPVHLDGGENACSIHPLGTPGCVTLTVVPQPVTVFGHRFWLTIAGQQGKPTAIGSECPNNLVEFHTDPPTAERLRTAPSGTPAIVSGIVVRSAAVGFNRPKLDQLYFCLSNVSVRFANPAPTTVASSR